MTVILSTLTYACVGNIQMWEEHDFLLANFLFQESEDNDFLS